MTELEQLRLQLSHLTRRLEQKPQDWTAKRRTSEVMTLSDENCQLKRRLEDLERANGDLRASVAMLSQVLEVWCDE